MDALSIMAALGGGLRSRHAVVGEGWSVRSQHSLTTLDPSSRLERHRSCLFGDRMVSSAVGKEQCADREKKVVKGPVGMISFRGFGESTISKKGF